MPKTPNTDADVMAAVSDPTPAPSSPVVEIGEWCVSQIKKADFSLLGAFEATMKSRNKYVATIAEFDAAFAAFSNELAP